MRPIYNQQLRSLLTKDLYIEDRTNDYIQLYDFPSRFGYGYNSFLIGVKQNLFQPDSYLYILLIDKLGVQHTVTITQYQQMHQVRCYAYIDRDVAVGIGQLLIVGVLDRDMHGVQIPRIWKNTPNIKIKMDIYINGHYDTPSPLRFQYKPKLQLAINTKSLFDYQITSCIESLPLSGVTLDPDYKDYICLNIDTTKILTSVYYQKFLNYQITSDISKTTNSNYIFSGSIHLQDDIPVKGEYFGSASGDFDKLIALDTADIKLTRGSLILKDVDNSSIQLIQGQNISKLSITNPGSLSTPGLNLGSYKTYLSNAPNNPLIINQLTLSNSDSAIRPIQYISYISRGDKLSCVTYYFDGTINSIQGGVYAHSSIITTQSGNTVYGRYRNLEIKGTDKFPLTVIDGGISCSNIQITHSPAYIKYVGQDVILTNCYVENSYIGHRLSKELITFNYIQGELYSSNLFTIQQSTPATSYFSGSLRGRGQFYVKTSGSLFINNQTISVVVSDSIVELQYDYLYIGDGYNANVSMQYFSGSIWSSSIVDDQILLPQYYPNITFSKVIVQDNRYYCDIENIQNFQFYVPRGKTIIDQINIAIQQGGFLNVKSNTQINISPASDFTYKYTGYFNIADDTDFIRMHFTGLYQISMGQYELQQYQLISADLTSQYEQIFNSKDVFIFNEEYDKLYIPIALKHIYKQQDLYLFKQMLTKDDTYSIDLHFSYRNKYAQPIFVANSNIVPYYVYYSDISIYSGLLRGMQVYYNDQLFNQNNYQLLTILNFDQYYTNSITKSIDLPANAFSGESTNLLFKPIGPNKEAVPNDFWHYQYDVKINSYQILNDNKIYNVSYFGQTTVGGEVFSVNNMTGDVYLTAQNIPYDHNVLSNVGLALDYLFQNGGGGSGSVGSILDLNFSQSVQQFEIGSTQSGNVTVSWVYSPRTYPTAIHCYVYSAQYPSQTSWQLVTESILNVTDSSLQFEDDITSSLKITLQYMFGGSGLDTKSATAYVYFRNNVFLGKSTYVQDLSPLFSSLQNKYLAGDYKTCYTDTITDSKYIYMGFPEYMNAIQPDFVINDIAGGFSSSSVVSYTNDSDYTQNYIFYRSYNPNLGYTNLAVKDPRDCLNTVTYSAFIINSGGSSDHNTLDGLQGGSIDQRYHITSDMYTTISNYSHSNLNGILGAGSYHISLDQYNQLRTFFISTSQPDPSSGSTGDIWLVYQE